MVNGCNLDRWNRIASLCIVALLAVCIHSCHSQNARTLDAVMLTTGKDIRVFGKSVESALKYLMDVNNYYIITPNAVELNNTLGLQLGPRVIFVDEATFPFTFKNVTEVMYDTVKEKGNYVLDDKSPFEQTIYGRTGWFLQQLLKVYAGKVLNLNDYILLDSDLVWFQPINFVANNLMTYPNIRSYYYTTSNQWHGPYHATMKRVLGFGTPENEEHRSGITHHMVISKHVMSSLMHHAEELHGGLSFWKILLNQRAPKLGICGAGSTLSEYEIYFNYARVKYPKSVVYRPLLWANGPQPGLLFWPNHDKLESDGPKRNWKNHRQVEIPSILERQMEIDQNEGYHFVGYHGYARRRYFELVASDRDALCKNAAEVYSNTTCSWNLYPQSGKSMQEWFGGCGCYMAFHPSGP